MGADLDLAAATDSSHPIHLQLLLLGGIFLGVHFKAKKLGLVGLKREELPKWKLLLPKIYLLLPLIILTWMVIAGQTMAKSAIYGTIVAIVVGIINKDDRKKIPEADIIMETRKGVAVSYAPAEVAV